MVGVSTSTQTKRVSTNPGTNAPHAAAFVTTHWSIVLSAGQSDTTRAQSALSKLCQTYWYPLYAYVRGRGHSREDAQDLTQEFFARLLQKNWIASADREKGRFRSFLLTAMKRFLADEWDKARAQKRGGGLPLLSLQFDTAETRLRREPADEVTPEQSFERRWVLTLLDEVLKRLRTEYEQEGNAELFVELNPCLVGDRTLLPYAELAKKLALSESAVKSAVHRLRHIKDAARNLKLSTVNGRITADMILLGGGQSVSLDAVNGEVELAVPGRSGVAQPEIGGAYDGVARRAERLFHQMNHPPAL
jgi:RNA polymerase sigma-70 factor (ECF subfamily)